MIYWKQKAVGRVRIKQEGLFYDLDCECGEANREVLRLMAKTGKKWVSLGIPVPEQGKLRLRTRISTKTLPSVDRLELFPLNMEKAEAHPDSPERPIPQ